MIVFIDEASKWNPEDEGDFVTGVGGFNRYARLIDSALIMSAGGRLSLSPAGLSSLLSKSVSFSLDSKVLSCVHTLLSNLYYGQQLSCVIYKVQPRIQTLGSPSGCTV
jgi:hypothetical protein